MSGFVDSAWSYTEGWLWMLWQSRLYLYTAAAVLFGLWLTVNMTLKKKRQAHTVSPQLNKSEKKKEQLPEKEKVIHVKGVRILYGSQTGTAKGFARELAGDVCAAGLHCEVIDMKDYDPDDRLSDECTSKVICVFLVATYTDGTPTENAEWFCKWLEEASTDFRYGKTYLKGMKYAVFGLGNSEYVGHYNTVGKNVDKWLWALSASRVLSRGEGDCNVVKSRNGSVQADFQAWKSKFLSRLQALARGEKKVCSGKCKKNSCKNKKKHQQEAEDDHPEKHSSEDKLLELYTGRRNERQTITHIDNNPVAIRDLRSICPQHLLDVEIAPNPRLPWLTDDFVNSRVGQIASEGPNTVALSTNTFMIWHREWQARKNIPDEEIAPLKNTEKVLWPRIVGGTVGPEWGNHCIIWVL